MAALGSGGGSSGAIRAGKAFVEITANDAGVRKTLDNLKARFMKVGATISKIGLGFAGLGSAGIAPLIALAKSAIDGGSAFKDMSERLGATTEELSAFAYAVDLSGGSVEDLETGLKKMQQHLAASGGGGGSITEQLSAFADEISGLEDPALQTAAAMEIFGKGGTKLLPFLKEGSDGIAKLTQEAGAAGAIWSTESAANMDRVGDAFSKIWTATKSIGKSIGLALLPDPATIERVQTAFFGIAKTIRTFIEENSTLVKIIGGVGFGLVAVGTVLASVGGLVAAVGFGLSGLATAAAAVGTVFAAIVSPIGLIVAGIAAVGVSVGYLLFTFTSLGDIFNTTWGGIVASVKKGDLSGAFNIAWLGIKATWATGMSWLEGIWIGFKFTMLGIWQEITGNLRISMFSALADIQKEFKGTWAGRRIEGNLGDFTGLEAAARAHHEAMLKAMNAEQAGQKLEANAGMNAARAELDAAVARAMTLEQKADAAATKVQRATVGLMFTGTVAGGFGSGLSQSLSIGSNRTIVDELKGINGNTKQMAKALEGAGPLVWAA